MRGPMGDAELTQVLLGQRAERIGIELMSFEQVGILTEPIRLQPAAHVEAQEKLPLMKGSTVLLQAHGPSAPRIRRSTYTDIGYEA